MIDYEVKQYQVGAVGTNCYILINKSMGEAVIVDPGDSAIMLEKKLDEMGVRPVAILLTHGHFDHVMAAQELAEHYNIERYIHEEEKETLEKPNMNVSIMINRQDSYSADKFIREGDILEFAGFKFEVIHTPGHTLGGVCYYVREEKLLFSGDSLFNGSIGRTDFPGGSMSKLVRGIKEKLMVLPDDVKVYPGHDCTTTIVHEKMYNPYL